MYILLTPCVAVGIQAKGIESDDYCLRQFNAGGDGRIKQR